MSVQKFFRAECDYSKFCGTVGTMVPEARQARLVGNRNGIKRVLVAKYTRRPDEPSPVNAVHKVFRDLCPGHMNRLADIHLDVVSRTVLPYGYTVVE